MAVPKLHDHRSEVRDERFSGEFSCSLVPCTGQERTIRIRPTDVSKRGLGFIAKEPLHIGQTFWLDIGNQRFRVELAYCGSHLGIDGLYRCGLFLREADGDLHAICLHHGLLSDEHLKLRVNSLRAR